MPASVVSIIRQDSVHPQLASVGEEAITPQVLPSIYGSDGRLNMPTALRGNHEILIRQNLIANVDGLKRVQDDDDLWRMRERKDLVSIPVDNALRVDPRLPLDRRFCRPWAAHFLSTISRAHYAQFHTQLQVNSAVRTASFQMKLMRTNANAAQPDGEAASPHLTGQAIDLAKKGLSQAEIAWMRLYLKALVDESAIDVEEEFKQACFHISVYKKYGDATAPAQHIATTHRALTTALAATVE